MKKRKAVLKRQNDYSQFVEQEKIGGTIERETNPQVYISSGFFREAAMANNEKVKRPHPKVR